jgi:hypothetical protein
MQKGAHGVMVIAFTHQASNPYNNMYISSRVAAQPDTRVRSGSCHGQLICAQRLYRM